MIHPVAVLAGGLATRLGPLTAAQPKSLLDVGGRPFIAHQLEELRRRGVERVVLCVGHLGERIEEVVGDGQSFGLQVEYAYDGPRLLGTAGALQQAAPRLGQAFFVLYGDSYLQIDYAAVQRTLEESGKLGLMTVFRNDGQWDASNIEFQDGRIVAYDKKRPTAAMKHIDYGLGMLRTEALSLIPTTPHDLAELYRALLARDQLAGFEAQVRFHEIGSTAGLEETRRLLTRGRT
jgi:NDP-sugar pyrophosphorylase family protein